MTQKQLDEYLWGAANILRGMIDAADFIKGGYSYFKEKDVLLAKMTQTLTQCVEL
jgi:hypothetical protein